MIESLNVKDYILFDQAHVDFKRDMSAITGETGAGKSLLIDAITYLSGGRISGSIVRKGAAQAVLQMVLSNPSPQVKTMLEENGYEADEELIITRIVSDKGKSKMRINQQPASLSFVRSLMARMIDVHSQMDTIQLMNPAVQLAMLDQYAGNEALKQQVKEDFSVYSQAYRQLKKASQETFSDEELEFATAQLNEIDAAAIQENELDELNEKIKTASSAQKNLDDIASALYAVNKENGISDGLYEVWRILKNNHTLTAQAQTVHEMYFAIQNTAEELSDLRNSIENESGSLDQMQERAYEIKRLYRKYGGSYEGLQEKRAALMDKIDRIIHRQDLFEKLQAQLKKARGEYEKSARALSASRQAVFEELSRLVEGHAHEMMLENCRFQIVRSAKPASSDGIDQIDFMVSMNPGQPFSSLKQSASGGELSRLMLALKVVFQAEQGIDTIVFDEIDTGVSGRVALAMGSKMHALSRNYQVLCITHLPSVAVWADTHYRVYKQSSDELTTTHVEELDELQDLQELAVMAHGSASDSAVESMKQLKESVRG